jgi:DNA-binding SARP family transcriptional activator
MNVPTDVSELVEQSRELERAGQVSAALERAQIALEQANAANDALGIAAALNCLAFLHFRLGHYAQARTLAEQSLNCAPARSPAYADALLMLGMCATETCDLTAGEEFYHRAIDLSRQLGYARALVRGLHNLAAGVYTPRGQFDLALAADAEALRIVREHGMADLVWALLASTARVYELTGKREQATMVLEELHRVALPESSAQGYYFCVAANLALDDQDLERVPALLARARSIAEATGEPSVNVLMRLGQSRYHRLVGNASTAWTWANDALTLATRVEYCHLQGLALIERGRAAWEMGEIVSAETDWRAAIQVLEPLGAAFDLARARLLLAALFHTHKRRDALALWREAARGILKGGYAFLLEQERGLVFPLLAVYLNHPDSTIANLSAALLTHLERIPPPPLGIVTLGKFEVWQGKRQVSPRALGKRRARELLALLLLAPTHTLSFDQVVDALWRDKTPTAAQALFHQATSALRRALEPELPDKFPSRYVQVEEGQITLHLPAGSTIDFQAFEAHCCAEEWEAALALYRGDLFPDDRYAEWTIAPREHLKRLYLRALLITAHRQMKAGRAREALETCHRILEIDPWQEDAVLLGMRACLAFNDRAGAIRLYRELERTLREELNTVPQAALRKLYESLMQ